MKKRIGIYALALLTAVEYGWIGAHFVDFSPLILVPAAVIVCIIADLINCGLEWRAQHGKRK